MGDNPFSDLTDTFQDRQHRSALARKQLRQEQLKAVGMCIGSCLSAVLLIGMATGIGGSISGWVMEHNASLARDRVLGGLAWGLVGGMVSFFIALWRIIRSTVIDEVFGGPIEIGFRATLFWPAVSGAVLCGSIGSTPGLLWRGESRLEILACAVAAGLLALILVRRLGKATIRTSRTGSGPTSSRNPPALMDE